MSNTLKHTRTLSIIMGGYFRFKQRDTSACHKNSGSNFVERGTENQVFLHIFFSSSEKSEIQRCVIQNFKENFLNEKSKKFYEKVSNLVNFLAFIIYAFKKTCNIKSGPRQYGRCGCFSSYGFERMGASIHDLRQLLT